MWLLVIIQIILWTGCSTRSQVCPCFPRPKESTKEILRQYQDKNEYPDTWEWLNKLSLTRKQLKDCPR